MATRIISMEDKASQNMGPELIASAFERDVLSVEQGWYSSKLSLPKHTGINHFPLSSIHNLSRLLLRSEPERECCS